MEKFVDILIAILIGFFLSGTTKLIKNRNAPAPLRYIAMAVFMLFYLAVAAVLIVISIGMFQSGSIAGGIFFIVFGLAIIVGGLLILRGIITKSYMG